MPTIDFRVVTTADASTIAAIYAPYVRDTIVSFETEAPDAVEMAARIEKIAPRHPWLVAEHGSDLLGYAYACEHRSRLAYRWSADVAVYLDPSAQRHGIGRALYERLFTLLRVLGYVNAFAGIALPNAASVGLHEALGFTSIGVYRQVGYKQGRWPDVGWWQRPLVDPPIDPREPLMMRQLDHDVIRLILRGPTISS
jgi:phosphinothricin acetyltransferase